MSNFIINYHCPACGESAPGGAPDEIGPGDNILYTCPKCETKFRIEMEYYPVSDSPSVEE